MRGTGAGAAIQPCGARRGRAFLTVVGIAMASLPWWNTLAAAADVGEVPGVVLVDHVVATVDAEAITASALRDEVMLFGLRAESRLDRRQTLQLLVDELLFVREARKFVIIAERSVDEAMAALPPQAGSSSVVSPEARRERVRRKLMLTQFAERAFGPRAPRMTDAEARSYYESHIEEYRAPRQYLVRAVRQHVAAGASSAEYESARESLATLREALTDGSATLADVIDRATADPSLSADGDPAWSPASRLGDPMGSAVESLNPGDWSRPLRAGAGYAIVQVVDIAPEWTQELSADLIEAIARSRRSERLQALMQEWLEERRGQADIRILDEGLLPSEPEPAEAIFDPEGK